ncbi:MAG: ribonuclease, partial [Frondihabitans sp.]|nr:ribonuclease [Frondihabitans sp.]
DSQYAIKACTEWMAGWKRKGWRKADGKPVMNVEIIKELDQALQGRRVKFEWVRGHVGHEMNEAADIRARTAAEAFQARRAVPSGPGWPGKPVTTVSAEAAQDPEPPATLF